MWVILSHCMTHSSYLTRQAAIRNRSGASVGSWKPRGPTSQSAQVKYFIPSFDLLNQTVKTKDHQTGSGRLSRVRDYLKPMLSNVNISSTDHHRLISSSSKSVVNAENYTNIKWCASSWWSKIRIENKRDDGHREDPPFIGKFPRYQLDCITGKLIQDTPFCRKIIFHDLLGVTQTVLVGNSSKYDPG